MSPKRIPKTGSSEVKKWVAMLRQKSVRERLKIPDQDIFHFAGLISLLGTNEKKKQTFMTLHGFLLQKKRIPRLRAALELLPSDPKELWKIIEALNYFCVVADSSVQFGNLKPDLILRTMIQIPNHKIYIDHLFQKGFIFLGAIYHSNTLKQTKKELRGLFARSDEYLANPKDKLNIIHD